MCKESIMVDGPGEAFKGNAGETSEVFSDTCSDGANMVKGKGRVCQMMGPKRRVMYGLGWLQHVVYPTEEQGRACSRKECALC